MFRVLMANNLGKLDVKFGKICWMEEILSCIDMLLDRILEFNQTTIARKK